MCIRDRYLCVQIIGIATEKEKTEREDQEWNKYSVLRNWSLERKALSRIQRSLQRMNGPDKLVGRKL